MHDLHEGILHIFCTFLDDFFRRGKTTVRQDSNNLFGEWLSGSHENSGSSHGDSGEDKLYLRSEFLYREIDPCEAIAVLVDPEGNHRAFASTAGSLIHQKNISSQGEATLDPAAEIALCAAAVAMEHDFRNSAGSIFKVLGV